RRPTPYTYRSSVFSVFSVVPPGVPSSGSGAVALGISVGRALAQARMQPADLSVLALQLQANRIGAARDQRSIVTILGRIERAREHANHEDDAQSRQPAARGGGERFHAPNREPAVLAEIEPPKAAQMRGGGESNQVLVVQIVFRKAEGTAAAQQRGARELRDPSSGVPKIEVTHRRGFEHARAALLEPKGLHGDMLHEPAEKGPGDHQITHRPGPIGPMVAEKRRLTTLELRVGKIHAHGRAALSGVELALDADEFSPRIAALEEASRVA